MFLFVVSPNTKWEAPFAPDVCLLIFNRYININIHVSSREIQERSKTIIVLLLTNVFYSHDLTLENQGNLNSWNLSTHLNFERLVQNSLPTVCSPPTTDLDIGSLFCSSNDTAITLSSSAKTHPRSYSLLGINRMEITGWLQWLAILCYLSVSDPDSIIRYNRYPIVLQVSVF